MPPPPVVITITAEDVGLEDRLEAVKKKLEDFSAHVEEQAEAVQDSGTVFVAVFKKLALAVAAAAAGVVSFATILKSIGKAAETEALEAQFTTLLGGVEAARDRMEELRRFTSGSPFNLKEVAEASEALQLLTGGALADNTGLAMVGDIAAATGERIDSLANHVGALYADLQEGRASTQAITALTGIGVLSREAADQIKEMQKAGAAGFNVWKVAADDLNRFAGGMDNTSGTWNRLVSGIAKSWGELMEAMGEPVKDALKPFLVDVKGEMDGLKPLAKALGELIGDLAVAVVNLFKVLKNVIDFVKPFLSLVIDAIKNVAGFVGDIVNMVKEIVTLGGSGKDEPEGFAAPGGTGVNRQLGFAEGARRDANREESLRVRKIEEANERLKRQKNIYDRIMGQVNEMNNTVPEMVEKIAKFARNDETELKFIEDKEVKLLERAERLMEKIRPGVDFEITGLEEISKFFQDINNDVQNRTGLLGKAETAKLQDTTNELLDLENQQRSLRKRIAAANKPKKDKTKTVLGFLGLGDSLSSIGGGGQFGLGSPITVDAEQLAEMRQMNQKLDRIVTNTAKGGLQVATTP